MAGNEAAPVHDPGAQRWTVELEGQVASLDYHLADGVLDIRHTRVPEALGGRGIAGRLVAAAFDWAGANGYRVRTTCSYAAAWAQRHPERLDIVVP